jgi:transcriptional regulator with XRE-family HTH domain
VQHDISKKFSDRLRQLRKARGWTQEQAATECDIGYKLYQLYELGIKRNPGLLTLQKIAAGFGLEVHELLAPHISTKLFFKRKRSRTQRRPNLTSKRIV